MPHVLIVSPSAYTYGGLATWLDYLDPGLRERGWDVTIGLVEGPRHHRPADYAREHAHPQWVAIRCITGTPQGRCRAMIEAIRAVQPDLVLSVNMPDAYAAVAGMRAARLSAPKAVMALHGIQPDLYDDLRAYGGVLDGVICTNRLACRLAEELGETARERIHYAAYGVAPGPPRLASSPDGELALAYVGRLEDGQKRVAELPAIARQLDSRRLPWSLSIVGDGPDGDKLREGLAAYAAQGRVQFVGRMSAELVRRQVYPRVDAVLVTSSWEAGPIVIWEAMASGAAVISSRYVGSGLEGALCHDHNALLFPVGDTDEAARQIARLWQDGALRARLLENGYRLVAERYSIAASVAAWDAGLREVLAAAPLPSAAEPPLPAVASRLDRWLGRRYGESVRGWLRFRCAAADPGGEWPHAYGKTPPGDAAFWKMAEELDRAGSAGA